MKKKSLLIYSLVLILGLSCLGGYHSYAGTALISKGRMEFDNNTPETEDDAIFDVDDLKALDTKISEAEAEINNIETSINNSKQEIVNILNQNPNINIDGEVSFPNIITYIQGSTNVPTDTYFYEKGTEGSAAIVRYKKVGGKYYKCDANGKVAQGAQEVNVSGKQLEDYAGTKAGNLSAGAASYANGGFYLGDGSDNAAYVEQGKQEGIAQTKVGTAAPGQVLAGKTFTNASTVGATGTMVNNGAVTGAITTSGGTYTIAAGYHNGSGMITGPTLATLVRNSNVTLNNDSNLLNGVTAYGKDGVKYTGSMENKGSWTNTPSTQGKVTIPAGYHNGQGYIDTTSVYNKGITEGIAEAIENGTIHSDYIELILVIGYTDGNSNEPYADETFRIIIHNKNNIPDQNLLSGYCYYQSGWVYRITTTTAVEVAGEYNFSLRAQTPRALNIWGRVAWL